MIVDMSFLKRNIFLFINVIVFILGFLFVLNYMKYDVLLNHALFYPFMNIDELLEQGRYISISSLIFFYRIIPHFFPSINLNDLQNTYIAIYRAFVIIMEVFIFCKIFFISAMPRKTVFQYKSFFCVFILILLFLFNDYWLPIAAFMELNDVAVFFDYSMSLLFYSYFIYLLCILFFKEYRFSKIKYFLSLIMIFFLFICDEFFAVSAFFVLIFCMFYCIIMLNINKIRFLLNLKHIQLQLKIYNNYKYVYILKHLFLFFLVAISGLIFYFFVSNYKTLNCVGGGHSVDWIEQLELVPQNLIPFIVSYFDNLIYPCISVFVLLIAAFIFNYIKDKFNAYRYSLFVFFILLGLFCVNLIFLFIGQTNYNDDFYIAHEPIRYSNLQILFLSLTILFGFLFNNISCSRLLEKKNFIYFVSIILLLSTFNYYVGYWYLKKYNKYIRETHNIRTIYYSIDKLSNLSFDYTNVSVLPAKYYDFGLYLPNSFNGTADSVIAMKNLMNIESRNSLSRLFILLNANFSDSSTEKNDIDLFDYFYNVYKIKQKAVIFAPVKYVKDNIFPYKYQLSKKEQKRLCFSDIKKNKFDINEIDKLIEKYPESYNLYLAKANYYKSQKKYNIAALENYNKAVKYDNGLALSYYLRGLFYLDIGYYKEAQKDLIVVARCHPYSLLLRELLATVMVINEDYDSAVEEYSQIVDIYPYGYRIGPDYYYKMAQLKLDYIKDYSGALRDFNKSELINPYSFKSSVNLRKGYIYNLKKDYKSAIEEYSDELLYNPDNYSVYYDRGMCYYNMNNYDNAVSDFIDYINSIDDLNDDIKYQIKIIQSIYLNLKRQKKKIDKLSELGDLLKDVSKEISAN